MSTTPPDSRSPARQRGLGMVMAIFILVVLAGLAAAVTSLTTLTQLGKALDEQGARVYQAARAATEWAALRILQMPAPWPCGVAPGIDTDLTIDGWAVTVNCTELAAGSSTEVGLGALYRITATACAPAAAGPACPGVVSGGGQYIERSLRTLLERPAS